MVRTRYELPESYTSYLTSACRSRIIHGVESVGRGVPGETVASVAEGATNVGESAANVGEGATNVDAAVINVGEAIANVGETDTEGSTPDVLLLATTGVRNSEGMISVCPDWRLFGSVIPLAATSSSTVVLKRSAMLLRVSFG